MDANLDLIKTKVQQIEILEAVLIEYETIRKKANCFSDSYRAASWHAMNVEEIIYDLKQDIKKISTSL